MKSTIIAIGTIAAASVASASILPMFMKQGIEMTNMLLGKASQAHVQSANEKHPLDLGPFVAKGSTFTVLVSPNLNATVKANIFNAADMKLSRGRSSMVVQYRAYVTDNAPHDFKSMLNFANGFDKTGAAPPVNLGPVGSASVLANDRSYIITKEENSDPICKVSDHPAVPIDELPSLGFLSYDFFGDSLVKVYTVTSLNSNHHFTKLFGLKQETQLNGNPDIYVAIDAFNGNLVAIYMKSAARDVQSYSLTLYEEFTRVDSIMPFTQVPADLAATCTPY